MKCKVLIGGVVVAILLFGGANPGPSQKKDDPPKKAKKDEELAKLGKARANAAQALRQAEEEWLTASSQHDEATG